MNFALYLDTNTEVFNYLKSLSLGEKFQQLAEVYQQQIEVPTHIEKRWQPLHQHSRALIEARNSNIPHSQIRQPIWFLYYV